MTAVFRAKLVLAVKSVMIVFRRVLDGVAWKHRLPLVQLASDGVAPVGETRSMLPDATALTIAKAMFEEVVLTTIRIFPRRRELMALRVKAAPALLELLHLPMIGRFRMLFVVLTLVMVRLMLVNLGGLRKVRLLAVGSRALTPSRLPVYLLAGEVDGDVESLSLAGSVSGSVELSLSSSLLYVVSIRSVVLTMVSALVTGACCPTKRSSSGRRYNTVYMLLAIIGVFQCIG